MTAESDVPLLATSIIFTSVPFIVVILRLVTRLCIVKNPGADDYLMTVALVS